MSVNYPDEKKTISALWRDTVTGAVGAGAAIADAIDAADMAVHHFRSRFTDDRPYFALGMSVQVAMKFAPVLGLRVVRDDDPLGEMGEVKDYSPSINGMDAQLHVEWDASPKEEDREWVPVSLLRVTHNPKPWSESD